MIVGYSGVNYTACPVIGNHSSGLLETIILGGYSFLHRAGYPVNASRRLATEDYPFVIGR
jgi:hypothetical protein